MAPLAYVVVGWIVHRLVVTQVENPAWVAGAALVVIAAGFPVAIYLAWRFDITPQGIKETGGVGGPQKAARRGLW